MVNRMAATVVVKGRMSYIDRRYSFDADAPVYQFHGVVAYNGKRSTQYQTQGDPTIAAISTERSRESSTQGLGFFDLNLLNPARPEVRGYDDQNLIHLLRDRSARVRNKIELVNDRACHVVETPGMTVWLDAERGGVPLRHAYHTTSLTSDRPTMIFLVEQVAEVSPGLWLATRGRKIVAPHPGSPETVGGIEHTMFVSGAVGEPSIRINAGVDDDFFDLWKSLPPGTMCWDKDTGKSWTVFLPRSAADEGPE